MWVGALAFIAIGISHDVNACRPRKKFPDSFLLGVSTSAYQIEGSWNVDGKGESIWDYYIHKQPDVVEDFTNGDIASDSYVLYERNIEILKHLGAKSYRFSISWTRILPDGTTNYINPLGIAHYGKLIDLLLEHNILPLVTIYHWDLPIAISDQGGWLNETTVDFFGKYARAVFGAFGDKVKNWITVNEPFIHCSFGYGKGLHPPFGNSPGIGYYDCGRNLLLAHARAYHIYDEEFRELQGGRVGIALDMQRPLAASDSEDDAESVEDYLAFFIGQYMDPIFKADYPRRLIERVAAASAAQGYPTSRLRPLSEQEKAYIHGTADFVGVNHYSSLVVYRNESVVGMFDEPSYDDDAGFGMFVNSSWPASAMEYMSDYSPGFYSLLIYLKDTYGNPIVYVTETGFSLTSTEDLNDDQKAKYLKNYLEALLDARKAGSNCQGYFFWSLLDTFEWTSGYGYKFGLYQVDFEDPNRKRTARKSALVYKEIIRTGTIDHNYNPNPYEQGCYTAQPSPLTIQSLDTGSCAFVSSAQKRVRQSFQHPLLRSCWRGYALAKGLTDLEETIRLKVPSEIAYLKSCSI